MKSLIILAATALGALAVLVALPVAFVVLQAIFPHLGDGSLRAPFSAWPALLAEPDLPALVFATLRLGAGVALVAGLAGIPLGSLRGLCRVPLAPMWDLLFLVPFLLPPYIVALSWTMALQPHGYVAQLIGMDLGSLLFSPLGVTLVMGLNLFPVVYFAVSRSMAASGGRLAEVARVFGASAFRAYVRVSLPLALPAIAAGLLLVFTLAIEEYGVPAALGTQAGLAVLSTAIERRLSDWPIDLTGAALLSLLLVAFALAAFMAQRALVSGKSFETTTGKPTPAAPKELGRWRVPVVLIFSGSAILSAILPLASMATTSLMRTVSGGLSPGNFTLTNFSALFARGSDALDALTTSLSLAAGTAILAGAVGFLAAWCVADRKLSPIARGAIDIMAILPAALPGVVVGVGLILAWNQPFWPATPYGTWGILLLSYTCLLLPYPVRYVSSALTQIGPNLEAAARVHGASVAVALRRISLPLAMPSLAAAMLMVFAVASRELVTSLLLAPAGVQTVSLYVWQQFEQGSVGMGMAMATVAVSSSLALMLAGLRMQRRAAGNAV